MENDTTGTELQALISQRQHRPSYTRAISYEFSQNFGAVAKKSRKSRKSQRSREEGEEELCSETHPSFNTETEEKTELSELDVYITEESDDSEYFSAEENFVTLSNVHHENGLSTLSVSDSTSREDFYTRNMHRESKRAPSKKQKRKRRLLSGNSNLLKELPFYNAVNILDDFSEMDTKVIQNRPVPKLYALCVKVLAKNKKNWHKPSAVPAILRQNIGNEAEFYKEQINWIKMILAKFEEENQHNITFKIQTRTIWDVDPRSPGILNNYQNKKVSCLPAFLLYNIRDSYDDEYVSSNFIMTALGCLLHLIIPQPDPCKGNQQKKRDGSTPYDRAVENATASLWKDYPGIMKRFYENVLPYVFWARGDVKRAKDRFLHLIDTNKKPRFKALYMYEIGRMIHFFDDPSQLDLNLSLSDINDIFLTKPYYQADVVLQQIIRQTSLLKANLSDQGVMTLEKARQALERWGYCLTIAQSTEMQSDREHFFYMDSLLCYHAHSFYDIGVDWVQNAIQRLEPHCSEGCPELKIFLSMLYAIQGNKMKSKMACQEFMSESLTEMVIDDKNRDCPWLALFDIVKNPSDVKPLNVLWRTQLNPPRFVHAQHRWPDVLENCDPFEADISGPDLNLHLTPEGHLTGDLQMSLPPIPSVLLNPYTGAIAHLPAVHSATSRKSFHSVNCYESTGSTKKIKIVTPVIPTPMEIYKGQNGSSVTVIFPGTHSCIAPRKHHLKLNWQGPNGEREKINLANKLREFLYKMSIEQVKKSKKAEPVKSCMLQVLKLCFTKDYAIPSLGEKEMLCTSVQEAYLKIPKMNKHEKANASLATLDPVKIFHRLRNYRVITPVLELLDQPLIFGEDIFLRFKIDKSVSREIFVVVHTRNRTEFKNLTIQERNIKTPIDNFSSKISKSAEVFYYLNKSPEMSTVCTLNRYLQLVDQVDTELLQPIEEDVHVPFIIRNSLFAISYSNCVYKICDQMETIAEHLGPIHRMTHMGDMLVLVTTTGYLQFVDSHTLLPIKTTVCPCAFSLILEDLYIYEVPNFLKIVGEDSFHDANNQEFHRAAILLDNKLVIIKIQPSVCAANHMELPSISVTSAVTLPGKATDICFLSESGGYLVSASIFKNKNLGPYRENLYHFDHGGQLLGVLPSLGRGPRSMFPVYLPGDSDLSAKHSGRIGQEGWHVYLRDGHDGIICIFLGKVSVRVSHC